LSGQVTVEGGGGRAVGNYGHRQHHHFPKNLFHSLC